MEEVQFSMMFFHKLSEYTKIIVGVGLAETGFTNDFEVIDLSSLGK
jgi:hypothetical protein